MSKIKRKQFVKRKIQEARVLRAPPKTRKEKPSKKKKISKKKELELRKKAKKIFKSVYKKISNLIGHNMTTDSNELLKAGKLLLGDKFRGVFASDRIPKLLANEYAILNLDKSYEKGSHWVGLANDGEGNTYLYDSFGRNPVKIIPNIYKSKNGKIFETDKKPEQMKRMKNCGQLTLTFLVMFDYFGSDVAKYI